MKLLERLGLVRKETAGSTPTPLEEQTGALHLALDSIQRAEISKEERDLLIEESLAEFRAALDADAPVAKTTEEPTPTTDLEEENMDVQKMQEEFAALTKRLEGTEAENKTLRSLVEKAQEQEADRTRIAKAETLVADTGIPAADVVELLKELSPANVARLETLTNALRAATSTLLKSVGSDNGNVTVDGEYEALVQKALSENPKLTRPAAIAKVARENPKLYAKTLA